MLPITNEGDLAEDILKNRRTKMKDYKITITGFHMVEENDTVIPEEFDTCVVITQNEDVRIGHWETGTIARKYDPRGAFYDGIGGHFGLDYVKAWKCIDLLKPEQID